jgi:hypothetical protein
MVGKHKEGKGEVVKYAGDTAHMYSLVVQKE